MIRAFAREYTFDVDGQEREVITSQGWSKMTVCNRGFVNGSFTMNRRKRSAFGSFEDAYQLAQNLPIEFIAAPGDTLFVQGQSGDQIEVTAGDLPFGQMFGPPAFASITETRPVALWSDGPGTPVGPDAFCQVIMGESGGLGNGFLIGVNKNRLEDGLDVRDAQDTDVFRLKLNRGDRLYLAGLNAACDVNILITPLPLLAGLVGDLVCW